MRVHLPVAGLFFPPSRLAMAAHIPLHITVENPIILLITFKTDMRMMA